MGSNREVLLEFAEYYIGMGIPVFPIHDGYKVPRKGSHGHLDATLSLDVFAELVAAFEPFHRVGLAARMGDPLPGSGGGFLVCLDVDEKHGASGSASLAEEGLVIPETLAASTRSGGRHYLFRSVGPLACVTGLVDGVDIKGRGGWIAVCPTSGYVWDQDPSLEAVAVVPGWMVSRRRVGGSGGGGGFGGGTSEVSPAEAWALLVDAETGERLVLEDGRTRALDGLMWYLAYREEDMGEAAAFAEALGAGYADRFEKNLERTLIKAAAVRKQKEERTDRLVAMFSAAPRTASEQLE